MTDEEKAANKLADEILQWRIFRRRRKVHALPIPEVSRDKKQDVGEDRTIIVRGLPVKVEVRRRKKGTAA